VSKSTPFLQTVDIFSQLTPEEIETIVECMHPLDIEAKTTIFQEGEEGRQLYIVESGKVAISIRLPNGAEREIVEFRSGDFFGEMSIFENAPRSASCSTKEKSRLLAMDDSDFFKLITEHPYTAIKIMFRMLNSITQRLRNTSEFLSDMVRWGETARKRAITDELTGAYNRRYLDEALTDQFESSKRDGSPFTLIMIDLDFFRDINESYGHAKGDEVILAVVQVFRSRLRKSDILARYGGDEFSVIMPNTTLEKAKVIAEAICRDVRQLEILKGMPDSIQKVTTSQGLSCYPENADSLEALRESADQALYKAKEAGRDRVGLASSSKAG
jgi:diguanylate cyclase (GGDEF)-like protein